MEETYRNSIIFEASYENKRFIVLAIDKGWKPYLEAKEILYTKYSLPIINEYGLTDMHTSFDFHGHLLELEYFSMEEMISLITDATDEAILSEFRSIATEIAKKIKG